MKAESKTPARGFVAELVRLRRNAPVVLLKETPVLRLKRMSSP